MENKKKLIGIMIASVVMVFAVIFAALSCEQPTDEDVLPSAKAPVTLIGNHQAWRYVDSGEDLFVDPAADFRSPGFDDSAWKTGNSPLGYPATEKASARFGPANKGGVTLGIDGETGKPYKVYYFRKTFEVDDIAGIKKLTVSTAVDDGYVMYLNGSEIRRVNMPAMPHPSGSTAGVADIGAATNPVTDVEATGASVDTDWDATAFKPYLKVGENILAVHVHNFEGNATGDSLARKGDDVYFGMTLTASFDETVIEPEGVVPKQVNVHLGQNAASEVIVSYTTVNSDASKIVVTKKGTEESRTLTGSSSWGTGNKYFHKIPVTGLEADTVYAYSVGSAGVFTGEFKTGPAEGSADTVKFVYIADTQVSNAVNAKALGATFNEIAGMSPDFVYLAGDTTDTHNNENQWQWLFENDGLYGRGGETMFRNYAVAVIQGNHDNLDLQHHITTPGQAGVAGKVVYSFDYGPITFIMLNLETSRNDADVRDAQEAFLREKVPEAKERGQWVAVGFHKSLYTGASHITDSDVIAARKFWCPKFAELDVDLVLQGHDHVYSRGFVKGDGARAYETVYGPDTTAPDPANAPLYMIGGHAGGLKWYSLKNYTVGEGDPLITDYAFLDVDSAKPGNNGLGSTTSVNGSDVEREQVIVELEVSASQIVIKAYMFKYDENTASSDTAVREPPGNDEIITPRYLYDKLTITRAG